MKEIWIEIKRLLKNNWLFIIVGSIILAAIMSFGVIFLNRGDPTAEIDTEEMGSQYETAEFRFYVELPDGSTFTNVSVIDQYFRSEDVLRAATNSTGLNLYEEVLEEKQIEYFDGEVENRIINVSSNQYSNLIKFSAITENKQNSMEVANYFFDLIQNDAVPFLQDKEVYIFDDPYLITFENPQLLIAEEMSNTQTNLIIPISLSVILGFIIMVVISFIKSLFSKKLFYKFSYLRNENDYFFLLDNQLNNEGVFKQYLLHNVPSYSVVLSEHDIEASIKEKLFETKSMTYINGLEEIKDLNKNRTQDIVLLVEAGETSREWYKKQRKNLEFIKSRVILVQVNH